MGEKGETMRRRPGKQKKPKRCHLTSLGPLVSFSPSISFFVTDNLKLFKLLTRTADDADNNRTMTTMWRGDDDDNYDEGMMMTTMKGRQWQGDDNDGDEKTMNGEGTTAGHHDEERGYGHKRWEQ